MTEHFLPEIRVQKPPCFIFLRLRVKKSEFKFDTRPMTCASTERRSRHKQSQTTTGNRSTGGRTDQWSSLSNFLPKSLHHNKRGRTVQGRKLRTSPAQPGQSLSGHVSQVRSAGSLRYRSDDTREPKPGQTGDQRSQQGQTRLGGPRTAAPQFVRVTCGSGHADVRPGRYRSC